MKIKIFASFILILFLNTDVIFSQANAGDDKEVCINQTYLDAELPTGYTGEWSINNGNCNFADIHSRSTFITNLMSGLTTLRWTINKGSETYFDDVSITNNASTAALTHNDESICENTYTIRANAFSSEETGLWSLVEGTGSIITPGANISEVTSLSQGVNKFEWKITKGNCFSKDTITITNDKVFAYAGENETTCNDFTNLTANNTAVGLGTWSVINSTENPIFGSINSPSTSISSLGVDGNVIKWTVVNNNCSAIATVTITSNKPTTSDAGLDKIICTNTTNLSANNPTEGTGLWSVVNGYGSFSHINTYNTQVNSVNVGTNTYKWTITKNGCISEDEVVIYYDYFVADAGEDDETCTNSYTLDGNNIAGSTGEWRVTGGSGTFTDENLCNTEVTNIGNGANTYEWEVTKGACIHTDYVVITQNTASTANAGGDKETCNGTTTLSAAIPAIGTGSWSLINGTGTFANSLQSNTSVSNISVNINNKYKWTVNYAQCTSYDEVIVINNFVTTNAGSNQIICGTSSTLSATPIQTGETGIWQILEGAATVTNINLYNTNTENLSYGNNKFKWTVNKGICSASDEVEILNNKYYASATISGPSEICNDYSSINGNMPPSGGIGFWEVQSGAGVFDNSNDNSTIVRNLLLGENIIRWILSKDNCENFSEITINRNTVFSNAGADASVCENIATLSAIPTNTGETGVWSVTSGSGQIVNSLNNNSDVTNLNLGINTFTWTISDNNCTAEDNVIITNNKFNTNAGANQQICVSNTSLSASNIGYGYWEVFDGTGTFSSPSNRNTNVSNIPSNSNNTYRWHAFENGCTDTDGVNVTNNLIIANAGTDFSVCNNTATLNADNPVLGNGTWTNQAGAGSFADTNSPSTEVTNLGGGINTFRWTVSNLTCVSYNDVSVENNHTSVSAGPDQEICNNFTQLSGGQPPIGETGLWEIDQGYVVFENANLYNTNITEIQSGLNILKWTINNSGCISNVGEVNITNKGFIADAGADQILDNFVTSTNLNSILPDAATAYWTLVGGYGDITDINNPNTEITNMETGINQFLWSVSKNGCVEEDVVNITVVNFTPNAGVDRIICTDSIQLSAANYNGAIQMWSVIEGAGDFDNPYSYNTWVKNIGVGINKYRWTVTQDGATAYNDVIVTAVFANAGEDQVLSIPSATLDGNIPIDNCTGNWSLSYGSANISSNSLYNTEISNLNSNINTFKWTIQSQECSVSDYVDIIYFTPSAGNDKIICEDSVKLSASDYDGEPQVWSIIEGSGDFVDENAHNTWVKNIGEGLNIYRWTVTKYGETTFDDISISQITIDAGEDQTVTSTSATLNGNIPFNNCSGLWSKISSSGDIDTPTLYNSQVTNLDAYDNVFKWTISSGECSLSDFVKILYDNSNDIINFNNEFHIYPNPNNGSFIINTSENIEYNVMIYTLYGKTIFNEDNITENNKHFDISMHANGIYFIKITKNGKENTIKIVKK